MTRARRELCSPTARRLAWATGDNPGSLRHRRNCTGDTLLSIIQAAGWPIWPLILCSVVALTIIIERLISLRPTLVAPNNLLDEVMAVTRTSLPGSDVVNKLAENSVLGGVFATGLRSVIAEPRITEEAVRQSFENAGRIAVHRLERYLNTLGTIAAAAPLLGLFGTVVGMIEIFGSQAPTRRRRQQPAAAGARHLGGAVQHRLRADDRDPVADVLPLLPRPRRRVPADDGTGRRAPGAAPDALRRAHAAGARAAEATA